MKEGLRNTIIISDVHLSAGSLGYLTKKLQDPLCRFIQFISDASTPTELIINGDFFDFVLTEPWEEEQELISISSDGVRLCFTEEQSCEKLENIVNECQLVFDALKHFLDVSINNRILMIPGNHDVDLFWPKVRNRLKNAICPTEGGDEDRLLFHLEEYYLLDRGEKKYRIEHGHQHDIVNRFVARGERFWSIKNPPILDDVNGKARLLLCDGSYALIRYINPYHKTYPALSYINPYSHLLFALVNAEQRLGDWRGPLVCWLLTRLIFDCRRSLGSEDDSTKLLYDLVNNMSTYERDAFMVFLENHGITISQPLDSFVAHQNNCARILDNDYFSQPQSMAAPLDSVRISENTLGAFVASAIWDYEISNLRLLARNEKKLGRADYLIVGHTHKATPERTDGPYLNSGCWVPNLRTENTSSAIQALDGKSPLPYILTYIQISDNGKSAPSIRNFGIGHI